MSTQQLVFDLMALQTRIQKRLTRALSLHGLGPSDYFVLHQLSLAPNANMQRNELAEQVGLTPSGITRLLNPLEKIGLVGKEANPRDARVSLVALTDTGKQIYQDATTSFQQAADGLFESFNSSQLDQLSELVRFGL